ncbi:hypothetical protein PflCFBP13510_09880 [Pseudomonas fluorescens]|nr:hypothetical protein PflCFBP13510_09880 [Pseudomonas fluorescens]
MLECKVVFRHGTPSRGVRCPTFGGQFTSGRNPKWPLPQQWICTQSNCVDCQAAFASKPAPTVGWWGVRKRSVGWQAVIAGKPAPTIGSGGVR